MRLSTPLAVLLVAFALGGPVGAVAAATSSGSFKGKTSQNRTVTFTVKAGKVTRFSAGVNMLCGQSGLEFNAVIPPRALAVSRGRFSYSGRDRTDGTNITIKGTLAGARASGTIRMTDSRYDASNQSFDACVGSARWTARRR